MKRLVCLLLCLHLLSSSALAWGYFGTFYYPVDQLGAFNSTNFSSSAYYSANARLLTWSAAPPYNVMLQGVSAYPADFVITPNYTETVNFVNYRTFSYYRFLDNAVGTTFIRPGAGTYGFGTRNQQPITNRPNVDNFKTFRYTTHKVLDYVSGINPRRSPAYSPTAWVQNGSAGSGSTTFPLIEHPSGSQYRKYIHSFTIPFETTGGTYSRYVWHCTPTLSANTQSAVYIISTSQYDNFIHYRTFSYYKQWIGGSGTELRLPYGNYYVVAINAINTYAIDAGSAASYLFRYR